jgi:nucleotide-binding universal stress UspA family protein
MLATNTPMLDSELEPRESSEERPAASPRAGGRHTPRILVAADTHDAAPEMLDIARELVGLLGAELHLVRVTPGEPTAAARCESTLAPTHPTLDSLVQQDGHSVAVAEGEFVPTVCSYARELNASLVILPGYARRGRDVAKLVRSSGRAVLVAKRRLVSGIVLAATDLSDPRFPVVRRAGALGAVAQISVVAVHNVCPALVQLDGQAGRIARIEADRAATGRQLQALVQVTSNFKIQTAVLTSLLDPVDAILHEARSRDASLVVVGAHLGGRAAKRSSVSADLVNLAPTSVLVVPLRPVQSRAEQPRIDAEPIIAE